MGVYIFIGKVLPERAAVSIPTVPIGGAQGPGTGKFDVMVSIAASQVTAAVKTEEEVKDLETLRNYAEQSVRAVVDAIGYLQGAGYDVEITSVVDSVGWPLALFAVEVPELQKSKSERPVVLSQLVVLLWNCEELRRALADLRESVRSPLDTGFFCFRAIECLRQHFVQADDGENTEPSWKRLREALQIDRSWFAPVMKYALPQRHGFFPSMSGEERVLTMKRAWKVVDRFIEYARRGFQPLPEGEFELLKGS